MESADLLHKQRFVDFQMVATVHFWILPKSGGAMAFMATLQTRAL